MEPTDSDFSLRTDNSTRTIRSRYRSCVYWWSKGANVPRIVGRRLEGTTRMRFIEVLLEPVVSGTRSRAFVLVTFFRTIKTIIAVKKKQKLFELLDNISYKAQFTNLLEEDLFLKPPSRSLDLPRNLSPRPSPRPSLRLSQRPSPRPPLSLLNLQQIWNEQNIKPMKICVGINIK